MSRPAKIYLRMLEIGALTHDNYATCSKWIENHPIDLNSRHPAISEEDFLGRDEPQTASEQFDVISCSLVLNFVPDPKDRGTCAHSFTSLILKAACFASVVPTFTPARPPYCSLSFRFRASAIHATRL